MYSWIRKHNTTTMPILPQIVAYIHCNPNMNRQSGGDFADTDKLILKFGCTK
jgi:hypothetical protein